MRRIVTFALVFALGAIVGHLATARRGPPRPVEPVDFAGEITLFHGQPPARVLRPYHLVVDGRSRTLAPPPPNAPEGTWRVSFDSGRVQVACVEVAE